MFGLLTGGCDRWLPTCYRPNMHVDPVRILILEIRGTAIENNVAGQSQLSIQRIFGRTAKKKRSLQAARRTGGNDCNVESLLVRLSDFDAPTRSSQRADQVLNTVFRKKGLP